MTVKKFSEALLSALGAPTLCYATFSDKKVDGTKVLRIKQTRNMTDKYYGNCTQILVDKLRKYPNISKVEVRSSKEHYAQYQFIIQVEYTGELPELEEFPVETKPKTEPVKKSPTSTKSPASEGGCIKTEFGVGYYTDEEDKKNLLLWIDGVRAGMHAAKLSEVLNLFKRLFS